MGNSNRTSDTVKTKKILFLLNCFPTPSETFISDEIDALCSLGHQVQVLSLNKPDDTPIHPTAKKIVNSGIVSYLEQPTFIQKIGALLSILLKPGTARAYRQIPYPRWIKLIAISHLPQIFKHNPDHIHVHYADLSAKICHIIQRLYQLPFSVTTHGYDVFFEAPSNYSQIAIDSERVIAISDFNRRHLIDEHSLPSRKVTTHRCGINISLYKDTPFKVPHLNSEVLILTVARLHPVKGHKLLLEALSQLKRENNLSFKLSLIGDGSLRHDLEVLSEKLDIRSNTVFLGDQNQDFVKEQLAKSHLFVLPSLSEGIPISMMESMASRTPVVGPNVNGVPELVTDKENGFLFTPGDTGSLKSKIMEALTSKDLERVTDRAFDKVRKNHDLMSNTQRKFDDILSDYLDVGTP